LNSSFANIQNIASSEDVTSEVFNKTEWTASDEAFGIVNNPSGLSQILRFLKIRFKRLWMEMWLL